jgi:hypothetical protein
MTHFVADPEPHDYWVPAIGMTMSIVDSLLHRPDGFRWRRHIHDHPIPVRPVGVSEPRASRVEG